jgi:hypothetical protein
VAQNSYPSFPNGFVCPVVKTEFDAARNELEPGVEKIDMIAKDIASWLGYGWEGLRDGRITDRGFPIWAFDGLGHKHFQGGKQDLRDLAEKIIASSRQ